MKRNKILLFLLVLVLICSSIQNVIEAVDFKPGENGDDELYKEYTAKLIDLQINTLVSYDDFDPEFGGYDVDPQETPLSLLGAVKINHNNEILNTLPVIELVDKDNNVVAYTEVEAEEDSDIYYLYINDLNVQNNMEYKLSATITDNSGNTITKYVTYSDDMMISTDGTNTMTYRAINNIATITFDLKDTVLKGDMNGDGKVNAIDVSFIIDIYTNDIEPTQYLTYGDMNNDGRLNAIDASIILDNYNKMESDDQILL